MKSLKRSIPIGTIFSKLQEPQSADLDLGTVCGDLRHIPYRYTKLLFIFAILGFIMNHTHQEPSSIFSMNMVAIPPPLS